jgi:hypothetical protein
LLIDINRPRAARILRLAVELLPTVTSPRWLNRYDSLRMISSFAEVTNKAVSLSIECKQNAFKALEILATGQGVLMKMRIELKSDIADLGASHPVFAGEFRRLREQLNCYHY